MKPSQERSNECLPPKKRELLVLEERALAAVGESQRGENLAWLASVASMASMAPVGGTTQSNNNNNGTNNNNNGGNGTVESQSPPSHEILSVVTEFHPSPLLSTSTTSLSSVSAFSSSSLSTTSVCRGVASATVGAVPQSAHPTVLSTGLAQPAGAVQYAPLPPNLQLIGPYTGYISSQVLPPAGSPATQQQQQQQRSQAEAYVTAVVSQAASNGNGDHHHHHQQHHQPQLQQQQQQQQQHGLGAATLAVSGGVSSPVPQLTQPSTQCIQLEGSSLGVSVTSPAQLPLHIHPHSATVLTPHTLTLGTSQLLVHYADAPPAAKLADGQARELYNGEVLETGVGRHAAAAAAGGVGVVKVTSGHDTGDPRSQAQSVSLAARTQVLLPAEYAQDSAALHTSLMLVPSSAAELQRSLAGKDLAALPRATEKAGSICLGKPISRDSRDSRGSTLSLSSLESLASPAPTLSPHTLLQTTHATTQEMAAAGIFSATPLPIIGYISGGASQQPGGYPGNLTQHLLISGSPSLLIPVSAAATGTGHGGESEATTHAVVSAPSAMVPSTNPQPSVVQAPPLAAATHAYVSPIPIATLPDPSATIPDSQQNHHHHHQHHQVVQVSPQPTHMVQIPPQPPATPTACPTASLPPYFMRGSIIQLADGELKRVEDLKTEDFIQSAEVSGDLKIDSSTVERIDCSQTPDVVVIQFSVGEHKAQVRVEVLVEYPFFVFGQGWSSCCPDKTTQLLELSCAKLSVGDVCISLTLRSVRNGTLLRKDQTADAVGMNSNNLSQNSAKPTTTTKGGSGPPRDQETQREGLENGPRLVDHRGGAPGRGEPVANQGAADQHRHIRTVQTHQTLIVENGRREEAKAGKVPATESAVAAAAGTITERPAGGRKRRWSAPERREAERLYEETPPSALPKVAFIPQEVKLSIEGRSSTGR